MCTATTCISLDGCDASSQREAGMYPATNGPNAPHSRGTQRLLDLRLEHEKVRTFETLGHRNLRERFTQESVNSVRKTKSALSRSFVPTQAFDGFDTIIKRLEGPARFKIATPPIIDLSLDKSLAAASPCRPDMFEKPRILQSPVPQPTGPKYASTDFPEPENVKEPILVQTFASSLPFAGTLSLPNQQFTTSRSVPLESPSSDVINPPMYIPQPKHCPEAQSVSNLSLGRNWPKIKKLRAEIWSLRSRIHEMRGILRQKQLAKGIADDDYFKYISKQHFDNSNDKLANMQAVEELLGVCQKVRGEYGPIEDDCNQLENTLGAREFELQDLETKFYEQPLEPSRLQSDRSVTYSSSPESSSYSGSEMGQVFHPWVSEYLSKVGDVEILRERLDWHVDEKQSLEEERQRRARVGMTLAPEDQKWLDNFLQAENDLIVQFEEAENKAEELRKKCAGAELIDEDGDPIDFEHREQKTFAEDLDIPMRGERSEYVKYPILIPQPDLKKMHPSRFQSIASTIDDGSSIPAARLDWWLLDQLRMSPMEVERLSRTFESGHGPIGTGDKWQSDVLALWYNDGTTDDWPMIQNSSVAATTAPARTKSSMSGSSEETEFEFCGLHRTCQGLRHFQI